MLPGIHAFARGPRLHAAALTTAASYAPRPFICTFVSRPSVPVVSKDPRRRPRPLAPRCSPRSSAPTSRLCIHSFVPHRGSVTPALPLPLRWDWGGSLRRPRPLGTVASRRCDPSHRGWGMEKEGTGGEGKDGSAGERSSRGEGKAGRDGRWGKGGRRCRGEEGEGCQVERCEMCGEE